MEARDPNMIFFPNMILKQLKILSAPYENMSIYA